MSDERLPPLGVELVGRRECSREVEDGFCGNAATTHVQWDASGENSLCCATHVVEAREQFTVRDEHPIGAWCAMPGASWSYDEKRCLIDGLDDSVPELSAARGA